MSELPAYKCVAVINFKEPICESNKHLSMIIGSFPQSFLRLHVKINPASQVAVILKKVNN